MRYLRTLGVVAAVLLQTGFAYSAGARKKAPDASSFKTLAMTDMTEAHLAELAGNKTTTPALKDLAAALDKDAINDYGQLSMLADKAGESIPKGIDEKRIPAIRLIVNQKGRTFDRTFLRDEATNEQRAIAALKVEAARGSTPDIRNWAGKEVATRQQDLEKLQKLMR